MFRRLNWITEHVDDNGSSYATGVYTSIYDLLNRGLPRHRKGLRLTLVKVDCDGEPLGQWCGPDFQGLADDLRPYVLTDEISEDDRIHLAEALQGRVVAAR